MTAEGRRFACERQVFPRNFPEQQGILTVFAAIDMPAATRAVPALV
jgi:hypothetical protein